MAEEGSGKRRLGTKNYERETAIRKSKAEKKEQNKRRQEKQGLQVRRQKRTQLEEKDKKKVT